MAMVHCASTLSEMTHNQSRKMGLELSRRDTANERLGHSHQSGSNADGWRKMAIYSREAKILYERREKDEQLHTGETLAETGAFPGREWHHALVAHELPARIEETGWAKLFGI
jgi:hypothetical protein